MGKRIVIALGGNALGKNLPEQMEAVRHTARAIVDLIEQGNEVVVAHGNGPQVGMIQEAMTQLTRSNPEKYIPCPLSVCVAMSQGYIGYDLQNALREEMLDRGIDHGAATVLTQVEVDPADPAFANPTKPIGAFMTREEADRMIAERGYNVVEDAGRGYRRVVASPKPAGIVELDTIRSLVETNHVVIACGGGGIPVFKTEGNHLKGAAADRGQPPQGRRGGHRQGLRGGQACRAAGRGLPRDSDGGGEGCRELWQARPALARRAHARRRGALRGGGPVRARLDAAQGPGGARVCAVRRGPLVADHAP